MADREDDKPSGFRKDGKPFKLGNTRDDGSYVNGKYRPPEAGKFKVGDNRKRGKREKGVKNMRTILRTVLDQPLTIGGVTRTGREWVAHQYVNRGIAKSDRAAETILRHELAEDEARDRTKLPMSDHQLLEEYFKQRGTSEDKPKISDDFDDPSSDEEDPSDVGQ